MRLCAVCVCVKPQNKGCANICSSHSDCCKVFLSAPSLTPLTLYYIVRAFSSSLFASGQLHMCSMHNNSELDNRIFVLS